jgi:hypothetical protein
MPNLTDLGIGRIVTIAIAMLLGLTAAALTLLLMHSHDEAFLPLLYPLIPGVIASLLITGGHGGTAFQEVVGAWMGAFVNLAFYACIPFGVRMAWNSLKNEPEIPKRKA